MRIAQLVIAPVCRVRLVEGEVPPSDRGAGGFGSTGSRLACGRRLTGPQFGPPGLVEGRPAIGRRKGFLIGPCRAKRARILVDRPDDLQADR